MSDWVSDLLAHGIGAAKAKEKEEAFFYLKRVLDSDDASHAQKIKAMEYMAEVCDDPKEKRFYFEEIIIREPGNPIARRGLALLNGDIKPDEVIDPTHRRTQATVSPAEESQMQEAMYSPNQPEMVNPLTRRFVCRQCGGAMAFMADGQSLTCGYCDRQVSLFKAIEEGAMVEEKDFAVALATAKGHTHPVKMQSFTCQGCAAPFVLGPAVLSLTCPYCGSAHVIENHQTQALIPPEGVVPFSVTPAEAKQHFYNWLEKKNLLKKSQTSRPLGLYLPVWTFDIAGKVTARAMGYEQTEEGRLTYASRQLERPIFYNDIPVPASHRLPAKLAEEVAHFRLEELKPYDPGYLADWPADTYQISAADASLVARKQAWQDARTQAGGEFKSQIATPFGGSDPNMALSSADMYVEAFKLILLPLWIIRYRCQEETRTGVVNGQTGHVRAETPLGKGMKGWFKRVLG